MAEGAAPDSSELSPVYVETHTALHEARSLALAEMPAGAETVLSAGASGSWYFDWVETEYGKVKRHIGVEAYLPEPADLPENAEWVAADLAGPDGVAGIEAATIDLVFSGQNFEHLWPDQMLAFLVESNRVLHEGGWLIVDSPNRSLTAELRWSMPEHTVELTPDEAETLFSLAGFSVEAMKGVWLCREGGNLLPLGPPGPRDGRDSVLRRVALARDRPEDSFIWWAEARKVAKPDSEGLKQAIRALFETAWDERVSRIAVAPDGISVVMPDGRPGVHIEVGAKGCVMFGPSMPLPGGTYDFTVEILWCRVSEPDSPIARLEVVAGNELVDSAELVPRSMAGTSPLVCRATIAQPSFDVHNRLIATGNSDLQSPLALQLSPDPWR
ncbi:MAG: methyltransferase domain-containing protein [Acidimicrobiales bacterium]